MGYYTLQGAHVWLLDKERLRESHVKTENPCHIRSNITNAVRYLSQTCARRVHQIPVERNSAIAMRTALGKRKVRTQIVSDCSTFSKFPRKLGTSQLRASCRWLAPFSSFALTSVKAGGQSLRVLLLDLVLSSTAEELEGQTRVRQRKTNRKHNYVAYFYLYV